MLMKHRTELARTFHRTIANISKSPDVDALPTSTPITGTMFVYTITGTPSSVAGADSTGNTLAYTPGKILVYRNGTLLVDTDYTAINGTSIAKTTGTFSNLDVIVVQTFDVLLYENPRDNFYVFLSRTTAWPSGDTLPANVADSRVTESDIKRNILACKRVRATDAVLMVPRIDWVSGFVPEPYRDDISLEGRNFYVMNSAFRIYKCLYSPSIAPSVYLPSTIEPASISQDAQITAEGHIWKLIYEIPVSDRVKFLTSTLIPVRYYSTSRGFDHNGYLADTDIVDGGTGYASPPTVMILGDGIGAAATATLTSGVITSIAITDGGYGYTFAFVVLVGGSPTTSGSVLAVLSNTDVPSSINQNSAAYAQATKGSIDLIEVTSGGMNYISAATLVTIRGDGTGAAAGVSINSSGVITGVNVSDQGTGYTFADVVVTNIAGGTGSGAVLKALITPEGGHGSNIPQELLAVKVCISVTIEASVSDFFEGNDFRQMGLIKNPRTYDGLSYVSERTANGCFVIKVLDETEYNNDDVITTDTGGEYVVVYVNAGTKQVFLLPLIDSISAGSVMVNTTTAATGLAINTLVANHFLVPELSHKSGDIIYMKDFASVTRGPGQEELIKLYFSF